MKDKVMSAMDSIANMTDGVSLFVGGFANVGAPQILCDALAEKGVKDLFIIDCDAGRVNQGVGKLLKNGQVRKLIATHTGVNSEFTYRTPDQPNYYNVESILQPQGTLAEQIRAGGYGLGGVLTPVGIGTVVEEGKQKITLNGKDYLIEEPLTADYAFIRASVADKFGNCIYYGATRTFNTVMAMAAKHVIVAAERIVEIGELDPNFVMTPGILVEAVVGGEK